MSPVELVLLALALALLGFLLHALLRGEEG